MGFRTLDLDNKEQAKEYKKSKQHSKFVKENTPYSVESKDEDKTEEPVEEVKEEPVKIEDGAPVLYGTVVKIDRLRVRQYPEGDIIALLDKGDDIKILEDYDDQWYKVQTNDNIVGYCMKTYIVTYSETVGVNDNRRCKPCPRIL